MYYKEVNTEMCDICLWSVHWAVFDILIMHVAGRPSHFRELDYQNNTHRRGYSAADLYHDHCLISLSPSLIRHSGIFGLSTKQVWSSIQTHPIWNLTVVRYYYQLVRELLKQVSLSRHCPVALSRNSLQDTSTKLSQMTFCAGLSKVYQDNWTWSSCWRTADSWSANRKILLIGTRTCAVHNQKQSNTTNETQALGAVLWQGCAQKVVLFNSIRTRARSIIMTKWPSMSPHNVCGKTHELHVESVCHYCWERKPFSECKHWLFSFSVSVNESGQSSLNGSLTSSQI